MGETITVTEAATDAGITRNAVWVAIKRGSLKAKKRGRDWHIERTEWARYKATSLRSRPKDTTTDTPKEGNAGETSGDLPHQDGE